jgi:hypothetical protein
VVGQIANYHYHMKTATKKATKKAAAKKVAPTIQSKGGNAVVAKYGKDHMKKLVEKRWKNAKKKD